MIVAADGARRRAIHDERLIESRSGKTVISPLRYHWPWMAGVSLLVFLAAIFAAATVPRKYTAVADLVDGTGGPDRSRSAAINELDYRRNMLLHDAPLSRGMVAAALDDGAEGKAMSVDSRKREDAIRRAFGNMAILPGADAGRLIIRFTADSAPDASHIVNAVGLKAVQYLRTGAFWTQSQMRDRLELLRFDSLRARSAFEASVAATEIAAQKSATSPPASPDLPQLQAAKQAQSAAHAELVADGIEQDADGATVSNALRGLDAQIIAATKRRDELALRYGSRHPEMIAAEKDLANLAASHVREAANAAVLLSAAQRLDRQERSLQASVTSKLVALEANGPANTRQEALALASTIASERYRIELKRYQSSVALDGSAPHIALGNAPSPSGWPGTYVFLAAGLAAALAAAALTYGIQESREKGLRSQKDVRHSLDLPLVALIPVLEISPKHDLFGSAAVRPVDYLLENPNSEFSIALRRLLSTLLSGQAVSSARSIAICSALSGEGKTTLSTCIARAAGMTGLRVVLVDCDGRRRESTRALAPSVNAGVVQILKREASIDQALVLDAPSGAWIIPHSSDAEIEPAPFSSKRAVRAFLEQLNERFDLVILDTAPVLALADARVLASLAEQVLLVAKWRTTPTAATRAAAEMLDQAGAKVTGAALTLVKFA